MKKLLLLMLVVGFFLSFSGCNGDHLEEIQPKFDLPDVEATDGELEEAEGGLDGGS